jgi:hypothetical protein
MFGTLALLLGSVAALCWVANPYAVWRADPLAYLPSARRGPANEVEERVTTAYRVRLVQPRILLLGSSRVLLGIPVDERLHREILNAALSGTSLAEVDALLRLADDNPRLERVVWGVDFYAFAKQMEGFRYAAMETRLSPRGVVRLVKQVRETLLSAQAVRDSQQVITLKWNGIETRPPAVPAPWPEAVIRDTLTYAREDGLVGTGDQVVMKLLYLASTQLYGNYSMSPVQVALAKDIAARARSGRQLIAFVPPMHACELEMIREAQLWPTFQLWKRMLLDIVGPYRDFSGYHAVASDESLFIDLLHGKAAMGQVVLRTLLGQGCTGCGDTAQTIARAGIPVDAQTIDEHLARQDDWMRAADAHPSRCRALLARALAQS